MQIDDSIRHFRIRIHDYLGERDRKLLPREVSVKRSAKYLEVGCGTRFTYRKLQMVEEYGLDVVPHMVRLCKKRYNKAHGVVGSVMYLPFRQRSYDIIVSNTLLHHLVGKSPSAYRTNIETAMKEMRRILKLKGYVLVSELITRNRLFSYLMFWATYICAKLSIEINWLDIHGKVIIFFMDRKMFEEISEDLGFQVKEIESKKWLLTRNYINLGKQTEFLLTRKTTHSHLNEHSHYPS